MKNKITFLMFCIFLCATPLNAEIIYTDSCGNNATYILEDDGTVTISGNGMIGGGLNQSSIFKSSFYGERYVKKVIIEEGITTIGSYAFSGCSSLTSVTIPNSVTYIGYNAFSKCTSLTAVYIFDLSAWCKVTYNEYMNPSYDNPLNYAHNLYLNGDLIKDLVIPDSITNIKYAFYGCSSLTSVTIPNSVTDIGYNAFGGCNNITSINYIGSLEDWINKKWYPSNISQNYDLLLNGVEQTSITIPNSVTSIGGSAFYGCSSLTSVTIPNSVTSIGKSAFYGCSSLTSITIPNSVTYIGYNAFSECGNLTSVTINSDAPLNKEYSYNTSITSIFGDQVTEYVLGNSITSIGSYAFYKNSGLGTSITIPNSVTSIGEAAFYGCSEIETISLGKSVQNIGAYAFGGCKRVTDIYCYAERVPDAVSGKDNSFKDISRKAYLWVPANRLRNYQTDEFWGEFDVRPMQAENANTDQVTIITESNAAEVIWPNISNADTYELTIKGNDGQTICTLIFNAEGQLQSIAFRAPAANGKPAPQATQATGFRFTVTGLEANTKYDYLINAKDVTDHIIETFQGEFTTDGGTYTDIENIASEQGNSDFKPHKVLENGQVIILIPDGRRYNMRGIEVR